MARDNIKNIVIGISTLGPLVAFGWWANATINSKADASQVENIQESVQSLQTNSAVISSQYSEVIRRLDQIESQQSAIARALQVPITTSHP